MPRSRYETNKSFYVSVGQQIAKLRQPRMTQEELAKILSLTRTAVINIEKGRQQILVHTLLDIARALDVSALELLPPKHDINALLRDKSAKGREWVISATSNK